MGRLSYCVRRTREAVAASALVPVSICSKRKRYIPTGCKDQKTTYPRAALHITRELLSEKLAGQERIARKNLLDPKTADAIAGSRGAVESAETIDAIRKLESQGAAAYWAAWHDLPITFPRTDLPKVPEHWRRFDTRKSLLSGSPRLAANPANAILNYLYAVLETETRLAVAALGLDPGLGFWHVDTPARDSLGCDLMEPVRPQVDAFLLDWITREPLKRSWFFEERNGNCRLMSTLAIELSKTAMTWGRAVAPFVEWVAQSLWTGACNSVRNDPKLPSRLTQRQRSEGRGKEFVLSVKPAPYPAKLCPGCGATTRLGRHCSTCAREISRDKLIELAKVGRIAAQTPEARKKHSATQRRHEAAKRAWRSSANPARPDEAVYGQQIRPRLTSVTISAISSALGISESYAADIRAGRHRPHPRHWQALAELVGVTR